MEDSTSQGQHTDPQRRNVSLLVYGNTAAEIELAALDEARAFFGDDLCLEIVRNYQAYRPLFDGNQAECARRGAQFMATVVVRVVEDAS